MASRGHGSEMVGGSGSVSRPGSYARENSSQ